MQRAQGSILNQLLDMLFRSPRSLLGGLCNCNQQIMTKKQTKTVFYKAFAHVQPFSLVWRPQKYAAQMCHKHLWMKSEKRESTFRKISESKKSYFTCFTVRGKKVERENAGLKPRTDRLSHVCSSRRWFKTNTSHLFRHCGNGEACYFGVHVSGSWTLRIFLSWKGM